MGDDKTRLLIPLRITWDCGTRLWSRRTPRPSWRYPKNPGLRAGRCAARPPGTRGGCTGPNAPPRATLLPFPRPWHGNGAPGLGGGPARPNRLPAHTREKSRGPSCLSGVALRLRAPAAASLDAAGRREREALGSLQARMGASAAPPAPSQGVPWDFGFLLGGRPLGRLWFVAPRTCSVMRAGPQAGAALRPSQPGRPATEMGTNPRCLGSSATRTHALPNKQPNPASHGQRAPGPLTGLGCKRETRSHSPQRSRARGWRAGPGAAPALSSPARQALKPTARLCRTGSAQQQPCQLPTQQHSPACPAPPAPIALLFFSPCSLPGSKLPPLPVLQALFGSEIRSSPAALY